MRTGIVLFLLGFLSVSSLYYITLEHNKLNKGFHDRAKLTVHQLETDRIKAKADLQRERSNELKLVYDKGMIRYD